jgi:hypothetical protein
MRRIGLALVVLTGGLALAAAGRSGPGPTAASEHGRSLLGLLPDLFGKGKGYAPAPAPCVTPVIGKGTTLVPQETTEMVQVRAAAPRRPQRGVRAPA